MIQFPFELREVMKYEIIYLSDQYQHCITTEPPVSQSQVEIKQYFCQKSGHFQCGQTKNNVSLRPDWESGGNNQEILQQFSSYCIILVFESLNQEIHEVLFVLRVITGWRIWRGESGRWLYLLVGASPRIVLMLQTISTPPTQYWMISISSKIGWRTGTRYLSISNLNPKHCFKVFVVDFRIIIRRKMFQE